LALGGGWKFIEEEMFQKVVNENKDKKSMIDTKVVDNQLVEREDDSPKSKKDDEQSKDLLLKETEPLK
jgi:hypothetical protein